MKFTLSLIAIFSMISAPLHARTWTSSDGAKSFEGKYLSSTETTVKVSKGGKSMTIQLELLSEADRTWVAEEAARIEAEKNKPAEVDVEDTPVGSKLASKVKVLNKKSYKRAKLSKNPEYYLVYFSASW